MTFISKDLELTNIYSLYKCFVLLTACCLYLFVDLITADYPIFFSDKFMNTYSKQLQILSLFYMNSAKEIQWKEIINVDRLDNILLWRHLKLKGKRLGGLSNR